MNTLSKVFVGVDVSKRHLDICILPTNKSFRIENDKKGFKFFLKELSLFHVEQVVCEASGGYEQKFINTLDKAKYKTWIVDPTRIKGLARAEGVRAKTDKIDANMIARFASRTVRCYDKKIVSTDEKKLKEFVLRKTELIEMLKQEKTRLKGPAKEFCMAIIKKHIKFMEKQTTILEVEINKIISENEKLKKQAAILETVPGVGKVTSATLISHVPELGTLTSKQIASLLGVAPITKESGMHVGQASISGGRSIPRKAIYMAALTASRCNPDLKKFYDRLIGKGKKSKVALVGVMRKLIVILNAMLKNETVWSSKIA